MPSQNLWGCETAIFLFRRKCECRWNSCSLLYGFADKRWDEAEHEFDLVLQQMNDRASKNEDVPPAQLGDRSIDDAVMLHSLTLRHLGREAEASALLQPFRESPIEESKRLAGYLLREWTDDDLVVGKRARQMASKESESVFGYRTYFLMGCRHFLEGNRDKAREFFLRAFEMDENEELLGGIARLRLWELKQER